MRTSYRQCPACRRFVDARDIGEHCRSEHGFAYDRRDHPPARPIATDDIAWRSPKTGEVIRSRRAREAHMEKHGFLPAPAGAAGEARIKSIQESAAADRRARDKRARAEGRQAIKAAMAKTGLASLV